MAKGNRTTSTARRATAAKATKQSIPFARYGKLGEWQGASTDAWCNEPFTHTIANTGGGHLNPFINPGTYTLVEQPLQFDGGLYVWCEKAHDGGPCKAQWGRPLAIGGESAVMLTTGNQRCRIDIKKHPFWFRVTGMDFSRRYARSETPIAVPTWEPFPALDGIGQAIDTVESSLSVLSLVFDRDEGAEGREGQLVTAERLLKADLASLRVTHNEALAGLQKMRA